MVNRYFRPFLKFFATNYLWKKECPSIPNEVVKDFIENQIPPEAKERIAHLPLERIQGDETLAFRRRIAYIYGIATEYENPDGQPAIQGWNQILIKNCDSHSPEETVAYIFNLVWLELRKTI